MNTETNGSEVYTMSYTGTADERIYKWRGHRCYVRNLRIPTLAFACLETLGHS